MPLRVGDETVDDYPHPTPMMNIHRAGRSDIGVPDVMTTSPRIGRAVTACGSDAIGIVFHPDTVTGFVGRTDEIGRHTS